MSIVTRRLQEWAAPVRRRLRNSRLRRPLTVGVAAVLAGSVVGIGANGVVLSKTRKYLYEDPAAVPGAQVAIVPGARVYDSGPSPILADRLMAAVDLYRAGKVWKIIVSGDHRAKDYDEPGAMRRFLMEHGVPSAHIFMDHAGLRTFDTMARAAGVFGVASAVICTQRFHLARSVYLARQHGIDAVGMVCDRRRYASHRVNLAREFVARTFALLDVHVLGTRPRHMGPAISLHDDAGVTHDRPVR